MANPAGYQLCRFNDDAVEYYRHDWYTWRRNNWTEDFTKGTVFRRRKHARIFSRPWENTFILSLHYSEISSYFDGCWHKRLKKLGSY